MTIGWLTAFLDSPPETAAASERFWREVTGTRLSPPRGDRDEFATLLPPDGDPVLKVQRVVQSVPGGLHLDVHTDDVRGLAGRVEELGGSTSHHVLGYVICGSPGGLTFCLVGHPGRRRPGPVGPPGARSLVDQVCLDVPPSQWDSERFFWAALTGWEPTSGSLGQFAALTRPDGMPLRLLLQRLDDEQYTVTAHLDLACEDRDVEAARHLGLGARPVRRTEHWTTLRDPAGRGYCLTRRDVETGSTR
jgi:glyoxalase superfamily protein